MYENAFCEAKPTTTAIIPAPANRAVPIDFKYGILYYCGKAYKIDKNTIPNILLE